MRRALILLVLVLGPALLGGCGVAVRGVQDGVVAVRGMAYEGRYGPLTAEEKTWARVAWRYVQNNYAYGTGLAGASDGYAVASMWDAADVLASTVAAHEIGLIDEKAFDERVSTLLQFLNTMALADGLPNRRYDAQTGRPLRDDGSPGLAGWSPTHLGRLLTWLRILRDRYPEYGEYVDRAVLRWRFCEVVGPDGTLYGGNVGGDRYQEGRLGTEEYVARGFQLWGLDTHAASALGPADSVLVYGVHLPVDARDARETNTRNAISTLPFLLDGLEFNWRSLGTPGRPGATQVDHRLPEIAGRMMAVQERRYEAEGILTARADHTLSGAPYFVHDTIWADGYAWNTVAGDGAPQLARALVSTKAAFGMWILRPGAYTDRLLDAVEEVYHGERGWYEGRRERTGGYERALSLSTNAFVLEALLYKQSGRLHTPSDDPSHYALFLTDEFNGAGGCFPSDRYRWAR